MGIFIFNELLLVGEL